MARGKNDIIHPKVVFRPGFAEALAARIAEVPMDTRDTTARTFGDPLPGRSALDQYRARNSGAKSP